jgi:hypothetical protein
VLLSRFPFYARNNPFAFHITDGADILCLKENCAAPIVAHIHPSGDPTPSPEVVLEGSGRWRCSDNPAH